MNSSLFAWALLIVVLFIVVEGFALIRAGKKYDFDDTLCSFNTTILNTFIKIFFRGTFFIPYIWVFENWRVVTSPNNWYVYIFAYLLVDLTYYFYHYLVHKKPFWAVHAPHHNSESYNLGTAIRQGLFSPMLKPLFYLPMALIGIDPAIVIVCEIFFILYQFPLHTETIGKFHPLVEYILNTPSNHRVHHGKNKQYIDKNFGGTFIIWDRLFGTYEEEVEPVAYGTLEKYNTYNALKINLLPWKKLIEKPGDETLMAPQHASLNHFKRVTFLIIMVLNFYLLFNFNDLHIYMKWGLAGTLLILIHLLGSYTDARVKSRV